MEKQTKENLVNLLLWGHSSLEIRRAVEIREGFQEEEEKRTQPGR